MNTKKQYITVLSIFSAFAVVLLHTNSCFFIFRKETFWITANVIESVFFFAAPVFFMISGATLIDYRRKYDTKTFFKKRASKIILPFIFWSVLYIVHSIALKVINISELSVTGVFNGIFNTSYIGIYWFFICLASVYLCIPVLSAIPAENRRSIFKYIIIVSAIFNFALPLIFSLTGGKLTYNYALNMPIGLKYVTYAVMGYYIASYPLSRKVKAFIYVGGGIGLCLILFGTWYLSFEQGSIINTFKGYENLPCLAYCAAVFLLFKELKFDNLKGIPLKLVNFFAPSTFGIYLMHLFFIDYCTELLGVNTKSIVYRIGGAVAIFVICGVLTRIIKKIPIVKKLIP